MEQREEQSQIWQRVFAQPQLRRESLRPLLLAQREQAAVFGQLAAQLTGPGREQAKQLAQGARDTVACLIGLELLSGNGAGTLGKPMEVPREPAGKMLERSYHRAKQAMTEYTARSLDGEFGVVFQQLARREEEHCLKIAQLLGRLHTEKTGRA